MRPVVTAIHHAIATVWRWLRRRTGLQLLLAGALLMVAPSGVEWHAAQVPIADGGQTATIHGPRPVHVVGVVSPGDDTEQKNTCQIGGRAVKVGYRTRWNSIRAGRLLWVTTTITITCERSFAAASGIAVAVYPLAAFPLLPAVGIVLISVGYARSRKKVGRR